MPDTTIRPRLSTAQRASVRVAHLTLARRPHDVRVFEKECRTLAAAGYDVTLAAPTAQDRSVKDGVRLLDIKPAYTADSAPMRWRTRLSATLATAGEIGAHIYHLHDPELIPVGLALKRKGASVIYGAHEDAPMEAWLLNRDRAARRLVLPALWWSLLAVAKRRFDLFVAVTPHIAAQLPPACTIEVRNYPRLEMFDQGSDAAISPSTPKPLIFPGLVTETRGALAMLDALAACDPRSGIRLQLYGEISPPELEARMRRHPLWHRVDFSGYQSWRTVLDACRNSLAGVMLYSGIPEQQHAIPVKLFEFLLAGIPVISTDMPLLRTLVDGNPAVIFVDPNKPSDVAREIEKLRADPIATAKLGRIGADHARLRFDWAHEGEKLVSAYDELAARKLKL